MLGSFLCGFQFDTDRGRHRGAGFTTLSVATKQVSNSSTDHCGGEAAWSHYPFDRQKQL